MSAPDEAVPSGATGLGSYTDLTVAVLIRELELANRRAEEAERFLMNFIALAPYARSGPEMSKTRIPPRKKTRKPWRPPPGLPHPRSPGDHH